MLHRLNHFPQAPAPLFVRFSVRWPPGPPARLYIASVASVIGYVHK